MPDSNKQTQSDDLSDVESTGEEELKRALSDKEKLSEQRAGILEKYSSDGDPDIEDMTPEEAADRAEKLASEEERILQILERGILNEKLRSTVEAAPDGFRVEFVRDRSENVDRVRALGGRLARQDELSIEVDSHQEGDSKVRVGDTVMMLIPEDTARVIDKVNARKAGEKLKKGRKEYHRKAEQTPDVPTIDHSHQR